MGSGSWFAHLLLSSASLLVFENAVYLLRTQDFAKLLIELFARIKDGSALLETVDYSLLYLFFGQFLSFSWLLGFVLQSDSAKLLVVSLEGIHELRGVFTGQVEGLYVELRLPH